MGVVVFLLLFLGGYDVVGFFFVFVGFFGGSLLEFGDFFGLFNVVLLWWLFLHFYTFVYLFCFVCCLLFFIY